MEDREKEESRALKMGKPIAEKDKPKLKTIPYYFEDGELRALRCISILLQLVKWLYQYDIENIIRYLHCQPLPNGWHYLMNSLFTEQLHCLPRQSSN